AGSAARRARSPLSPNPPRGCKRAPTGTISPPGRSCCAIWQQVRAESAQAAALVVGTEELVRARSRHRRRRRDLEGESRRRNDLGKAVDLAGARTSQQRQPRTGVGERGASADGADLEPCQTDRAVESAFDPLAR